MYGQLWSVQCSWLALYFITVWMCTGVVCISSQNASREVSRGQVFIVLQLSHAKYIFKVPL